MSTFHPVIGLEIHAQLLTDSKIFCACRNEFGAMANSNTCPVCLGLPGALPVLNKKAVEYAIKMGLATHCRIAELSIFARKNYFYPDLPKGYQISQYDQPLCEKGWIDIDTTKRSKSVRIKRIHLEEDAGKSIHDEIYVDDLSTLIDLNRCGTPLIEIVSEPDLRSPQEAVAFLSQIRQLVQYLKICDGNMEEGSLRCDANVSIQRTDSDLLGTRTELKNMNSFRNVEVALKTEILRQMELLERGDKVTQATLKWDMEHNKIHEMRSKEESHDYRYFPEPDLVPIEISKKWIEQIKVQIPELPEERKIRFMSAYNLPEYDAQILTADIDHADFFESVVRDIKDAKLASNWFMGEVLRILNDKKMMLKNFPVSPERLAQLLCLVKNNTISTNAAKRVFEEMLECRDTCEEIVDRLGLRQISDDAALHVFVRQTLQKFPKELQEYKNGKLKLVGFFIGEVMKSSQGKANPHEVKKILEEIINS